MLEVGIENQVKNHMEGPRQVDNCKYSFSELESTVRESMDSVRLKSIRPFAMRELEKQTLDFGL